MASYKWIYRASQYLANIFAAGIWRGKGVASVINVYYMPIEGPTNQLFALEGPTNKLFILEGSTNQLLGLNGPNV